MTGMYDKYPEVQIPSVRKTQITSRRQNVGMGNISNRRLVMVSVVHVCVISYSTCAWWLAGKLTTDPIFPGNGYVQVSSTGGIDEVDGQEEVNYTCNECVWYDEWTD